MSVVDASVWVSRFLRDDAFHHISRAWLLQTAVDGRPLVAPTILLAEVSGPIARCTGDTQLGYQVVQQIEQIPILQLVLVDHALGQLAAQIASERRLRGADAIYVAVAQQLNLPLITCDRELLNRVTDLVIARTPMIED